MNFVLLKISLSMFIIVSVLTNNQTTAILCVAVAIILHSENNKSS